jgi:hypothetical protein
VLLNKDTLQVDILNNKNLELINSFNLASEGHETKSSKVQIVGKDNDFMTVVMTDKKISVLNKQKVLSTFEAR